MAAKEIIVKKYIVRLNDDERQQLATLIRKGSSPAQRLMKARILLKADVSEGGEGWSDNQIIDALETSSCCFSPRPRNRHQLRHVFFPNGQLDHKPQRRHLKSLVQNHRTKLQCIAAR